jgi:ABC-type nickel/cobalt efflux system permease component RcnA
VADAPFYLLTGTAIATAAFHTLIPDHWLPFVLIGRARRWSLRTTAAVSGGSALLHTCLSVVLGLIAIRIGREATAAAGATLERVSGALLVVFGLAYAGWAWKKGGHFHPGGAMLHREEEGPDCDGHEGDAHSGHLHYHADRQLIEGAGGRGALYLALIVGLNPCVLVLPIILAAAQRGAKVIALVATAYSATTIALMVGLSMAGVAGARRFEPPGAARYMEALSGLLIAAVGVVFWLLER